MVQLHEYKSNRATAAMLSAPRGHDTRKDEFLVQPHDTLTAPTFKVCSKCKESKPATTEYFPLRKKNQLATQCRSCAAQRAREWVAANREQANNTRRAYMLATKAQKSEYDRNYYQANKEQRREHVKEWYRANPEVKRAQHLRRRALKASATGSHTVEDIKAQYRRQKGRCYWCDTKVGKTYHIDHIVPLARGGSNAPENLVIACPSCNISKGAKLPHEWAQGGRLL